MYSNKIKQTGRCPTKWRSIPDSKLCRDGQAAPEDGQAHYSRLKTHSSWLIAQDSRLIAQDSFTLIEMLVVIGIIVLVASISVVSVAPMMKGRHLDAASRVVQSAVYRARAYAANRGNKPTVKFELNEGKITIEDDDGNLLDKPYWLPKGVDFKSTPSSITFETMGSISGASNAVIVIEDKQGDMEKKITVVHTTGLVRVEDQ